MKRTAALLAAIALVAVACSDASSDTTTTVDETSTTTAAETTTTTAAPSIDTTPYVPGEDADADDIHEVFAVVFDNESTYEDRAPFIDDPTGLESVSNAYASAGDGVGGIFLEVTGVGVLDDDANVVYDLLFGGNPFQVDQEGTAVRIDGAWKVTREYFCSIMTLARVSC